MLVFTFGPKRFCRDSDPVDIAAGLYGQGKESTQYLWFSNKKLLLHFSREHTIEQNNGLKYLRSIKANKIIFDTDIGSDDAVAISFALEYIKKTNETTVVAICCTHGNTDLINVQNNTLKLLKTTDRLDVSIIYNG